MQNEEQFAANEQFHLCCERLEGISNIYTMPECESTNVFVKKHFLCFAPFGALYTTNQTLGRGRLGRTWENAPNEGVYYTIAIGETLAEPQCLPLIASLAVVEQLKICFGIDCEIKWPNDILLGGKKIAGILCESVSYGVDNGARGFICGIGLNLAQSEVYFLKNNLPHGTSLALAGVNFDKEKAPETFARALTDFGFDRALYQFAREGFAPYRNRYKELCVNIGKKVTFPKQTANADEVGEGVVVDIDKNGQLVVQTKNGEISVFTGEVSVKGIYGQV